MAAQISQENYLSFITTHTSGVSIKAGYRRSTAACRTLTAICVDLWAHAPRPLGERGLVAPLVVTAITAAYYTFSGRL